MHDAPKNQRPVHRVRIGDPEGLQSLLREIYEQHENSEDEAAKTLGITQPTFSRLLTGAVSDAMAYRTCISILTALGGDPRMLRREYRPTPFAVGVEHLEPGKRAYLVERARRGGQDPQAVLDAEAEARYVPLQRFLDAIVTDDEGYVWSHYEAWMDRQLQPLKPLVEPVLQALWEDSGTREPIADFLEAVGRPRDVLPGGDDRRCWLALCRALEPVTTAARATWGVESSWDELRDAEKLGDYLKAALRREQLLLKPARDLDRVKRGRPPTGYWEAMERGAAEEANFFDRHRSASPLDLEGWLSVRHAFFTAHPGATEADWQATEERYEAVFKNPPPLGWKDWEVVRNAQLQEEGHMRGHGERRSPGAVRPWVPRVPRFGPPMPDGEPYDG